MQYDIEIEPNDRVFVDWERYGFNYGRVMGFTEADEIKVHTHRGIVHVSRKDVSRVDRDVYSPF